MSDLDKAREIIAWLDELQKSTVQGTDLASIHPDDGIIHAIADLIGE